MLERRNDRMTQWRWCIYHAYAGKKKTLQRCKVC